jgi:transcriptional repressor NrdR
VSEDDLALLAQTVEEAVRASGAAEIASHDVGLAILGPLRDLDEIAYLRFASVYRAYEGLEDFEAEIALLRAERDLSSTPAEQPSGSPPTNSDDRPQQQLASSTAP